MFTTQVPLYASSTASLPDTGILLLPKNQLILRGFMGFKSAGMNADAGIFKSNFYTPSIIDVGVGAHTEFGGFHIWFNTGLDEWLLDRKNSTTQWNVQANFYTVHQTVDLNFVEYSGGYFNEGNARQLKTYPQVKHLGLSVFHGFNKNFSLASSFVQTTFQKKSQGSFVVWAGIAYQQIRFDSANSFVSIKPIVGPGYAHNFVSGPFFVGGQVAVALSPSYFMEEASVLQPGFCTNVRMSTGYNGPLWIAGISVVAETHFNNYPGESAYTAQNFGHVKLFAGRRLGVNWGRYKWYKRYFEKN